MSRFGEYFAIVLLYNFVVDQNFLQPGGQVRAQEAEGAYWAVSNEVDLVGGTTGQSFLIGNAAGPASLSTLTLVAHRLFRLARQRHNCHYRGGSRKKASACLKHQPSSDAADPEPSLPAERQAG